MDTIAAAATAKAAAGIGIVRISGDAAYEVADRVFRAASGKELCSRSGYSAVYGRVYDGDICIDEAIALLFRAPKSYTGEDVVELSCHGGMYLVQRVLRAVLNAGARPAEAGEFTRRAFLNGRIDLSEAEAVMGMINASGEAAAAVTLNVLSGTLSREIKTVAQSLVTLSAGLAVWADYPDDEDMAVEQNICETLENVRETLSRLLKGFDSGRAVTQGVDTAIIGRPNVGKSTLLNMLTGYDRAIVTDVPGTTRDIIEETVNVGNAVLRLADTAGIRTDVSGEAEKLGVELAKTRAQRAQLVLLVLDSSAPLTDWEHQLIEQSAGKKLIIVVNKSDLESALDTEELLAFGRETVRISALSGSGAEELKNAIERVLGADDIDTSAPMLITERQRLCVQRALECVEEAYSAVLGGMTPDAVNVSIDCAVEALLELTGERVTDVVTDKVFSQFCVGK